jgi:DNA-directed RNA polymerase I, II, and III subunit RPABC1
MDQPLHHFFLASSPLPMSTYLHTQRLLTMRCTLRKMLERRGYAVPAEVCEETLQSVEEQFFAVNPGDGSEGEEQQLTHMHFIVTKPSGDKLCVFFANNTLRSNLGIAPIRLYVSFMRDRQCDYALLVIYGTLTSPAVSMLRELEGQRVYLTAFNENELMVDIYEHEKVPRHEVLTVAEKAALLASLHITAKQLPEMQRHDPMARYLGLKVGDVVRIRRVSPTVGFDVYHRIVVNSEDFD